MKRLLYLLTVAALVTTACHKTTSDAGSKPLAVSGFWPSSGNSGTIVTISGSGFSANPENNAVTFNGTAARVMETTDTTILAAAPADGATGAIAVTINGKTAKSSNVYTYQALSIHGISPVNGPAGTNITISGAGFTTTSGPATVTINGKNAIVSNSNDTTLVAIVPVDAGPGPVEVTVNGQHSAGPQFDFQNISKIKPITGGPGTLVTITGVGFSTTAASNTVLINGIATPVVSATTTSLVVKASAAVQTGPLSVTINGQKTTGPVFTKVPPPSVKTLAPLSGPVGTVVTMTGDNFSTLMDEDHIQINGLDVPITSAALKQMTFTIPAGTKTGAPNVTVNDQKVTGPVFTIQALGVSQLLPDNGLAGTVITVKGIGFDTNPANDLVTVNGLAFAVSAATDTTLTVTVPVGIQSGTLLVKTTTLSATGPTFHASGVQTFYKGPLVMSNSIGLVVDSKGNVFMGNGLEIEKIAPDGTGAPFSGNNQYGSAIGVGTATQYSNMQGLAIDAQDNIYVADYGNKRIVKLAPDGTASIYITGMSIAPKYIAIDRKGAPGNLYFGTDYNGIYSIDPVTQAVSQASFAGFSGQFTVIAGNVYYSNSDGNNISKRIPSANTQAIWAGVNYQNGYIDGPLGTNKLYGPGSSIYDPLTDELYFVDAYNYSIRAVSVSDGNVTTISGAAGTRDAFKSGSVDGTLQQALFSMSNTGQIAVDAKGNIYVIESYLGKIRKIIVN